VIETREKYPKLFSTNKEEVDKKALIQTKISLLHRLNLIKNLLE
jgi:hypothetical protein